MPKTSFISNEFAIAFGWVFAAILAVSAIAFAWSGMWLLAIEALVIAFASGWLSMRTPRTPPTPNDQPNQRL